jgi:O-methyltransferase
MPRLLPAAAYAVVRRGWVRFPFLRPVMRLVNRVVRLRAPLRFKGWGMTTEHALPWDDTTWTHFRESLALAQDLDFTGEAHISADDVDRLAWRHWVVAFATRYAMTFAKVGDFVECGVADGVTAFFALRELAASGHADHPTFHLYDAWDRMRAQHLRPSELGQEGRYAGLDEALTRRNLAPFADRLVFHVGYVPASFGEAPAPPEQVRYVHIDLNAAEATLAACEFFWPRLQAGGVILFDDYGWLGFEDTKKVVDDFFADKAGAMLKFPTAQAMFMKR